MTGRNSAGYRELQAILGKMRAANLLRIRNSNIAVAEIEGKRVLFSVPQPEDFIQRFHNAGRFYEQDELSNLKDVFPKGGVYVDIGANIGNHALYVATFLAPSRVIPFEPNRPAIKILFENIGLNGLFPVIDTSHLGLGLSDVGGVGYRMETPHAGNLGMTHMVEGGGDVPLTTGDEALANEARIDLIKIDIEGMEMRALAGLGETIARTRPRILIEVDHCNRTAFDAWLHASNYAIERTFTRMVANQNFLLGPA